LCQNLNVGYGFDEHNWLALFDATLAAKSMFLHWLPFKTSQVFFYFCYK